MRNMSCIKTAVSSPDGFTDPSRPDRAKNATRCGRADKASIPLVNTLTDKDLEDRYEPLQSSAALVKRTKRTDR